MEYVVGHGSGSYCMIYINLWPIYTHDLHSAYNKHARNRHWHDLSMLFFHQEMLAVICACCVLSHIDFILIVRHCYNSEGDRYVNILRVVNLLAGYSFYYLLWLNLCLKGTSWFCICTTIWEKSFITAWIMQKMSITIKARAEFVPQITVVYLTIGDVLCTLFKAKTWNTCDCIWERRSVSTHVFMSMVKVKILNIVPC